MSRRRFSIDQLKYILIGCTRRFAVPISTANHSGFTPGSGSTPGNAVNQRFVAASLTAFDSQLNFTRVHPPRVRSLPRLLRLFSRSIYREDTKTAVSPTMATTSVLPWNMTSRVDGSDGGNIQTPAIFPSSRTCILATSLPMTQMILRRDQSLAAPR